MRSSTFVNWLSRILLGLGVAAISAEVGLIFGHNLWEVAVACGVVAAGGIALAVHAEWQERRRRLVRKARASLALPTQWSVKFDKRLPGGWVAPIAVIRDDGMRFVIDIQGFRDATWASVRRKGESLPTLVDSKDRPLRPDPVPALSQGGVAAGAAPVLWLPRAQEAGTFRHPDTNLVVVTGAARDLKLALQSARRVMANATSRDSVSAGA